MSHFFFYCEISALCFRTNSDSRNLERKAVLPGLKWILCCDKGARRWLARVLCHSRLCCRVPYLLCPRAFSESIAQCGRYRVDENILRLFLRLEMHNWPPRIGKGKLKYLKHVSHPCRRDGGTVLSCSINSDGTRPCLLRALVATGLLVSPRVLHGCKNTIHEFQASVSKIM